MSCCAGTCESGGRKTQKKKIAERTDRSRPNEYQLKGNYRGEKGRSTGQIRYHKYPSLPPRRGVSAPRKESRAGEGNADRQFSPAQIVIQAIVGCRTETAFRFFRLTPSGRGRNFSYEIEPRTDQKGSIVFSAFPNCLDSSSGTSAALLGCVPGVGAGGSPLRLLHLGWACLREFGTPTMRELPGQERCRSGKAPVKVEEIFAVP